MYCVSRFVWLTLCVALVLAVNRKKRKLPINPTVADIEPSDRSMDQWQSLLTESIRLACDQAHLVSTGSHDVLVNRLWCFHHPSSVTAVSESCPTNMDSLISNNIDSDNIPLLVPEEGDPQNTTILRRRLNAHHPVLLAPDRAVHFALAEVQQMQQQLNSVLNVILSHIQSFARMNNENHPTTTTVNTAQLPPLLHTQATTAASNIAHPGGPTMINANNIQHSEFSIADLGLLPSESSPPSSSPAIPKAAIDKIRNGEFVNFDNLLPNHSPVAQDEYTFKVVGGSSPSVSLVPKHQNKPKVTNFKLWMVSWTNYFCTYIVFWPHRVGELTRYQATICDFANQFTFSSWSSYDRMF